ncbi:hypothetical protein EMWEY_00034720 [Eimeria maxima]|uniref:Transmembrane protein n=1 Tax=Eimeria maxima TaxID=5804 RepID=U6M9R8_EIMMA|nr:hypothetical protein EMWEY_00034720 [Eimeria maxima]CDJ60771.1 hypothetical protein EMWEY_00034720 [Eimeria maxima]
MATKAPPLLPLLLFFLFVCRFSSSAASQHLDLFDEGFGVEGVHDVSRPEAVASATAGGDGRDGGGALEQVMNPGLRPVNMEWIRGAGKKFGLHALGSAEALLLLAVFIAAGMFAVALPKEKRVDRTRPVSPEEANLLAKWDRLHKDTQSELNLLQQELQVIKNERRLLDVTLPATQAVGASARAARLLRDLLKELSEFLSSQTFAGAKQLVIGETGMDDMTSGVNQLMEMPRTVKPIVEAVTVLSAIVARATVEDRAIEISRAAPSGIVTSLDILAKDTSAFTEHCKNMWQVTAEVEVLTVLRGMVEDAEKTQETALDMTGGGTRLQPGEHQLVGELEKKLEHAVRTARQADSLSAVVEAVRQYAYASGKLLELVWMPQFNV